MAGDWIPIQTGLEDEPEVVRIVSALCPQSVRDLSARVRTTSYVVGALVRTWSLFDRLSTDGVLHGYTAEWLDSCIGNDSWSENLELVGWLEVGDGLIRMPNYDRWLGLSSKRRLRDSQRKKSVRKMSAKCPQNVRKVSASVRTKGGLQDSTVQDSISVSKETLRGAKPAVSRNPPSVDEVREYAERCELVNVDPAAFVDHYTSNGWKLSSGRPLVDWQAACRNWDRRNLGGNGKSDTGGLAF
jgi:hypothetical protein